MTQTSDKTQSKGVDTMQTVERLSIQQTQDTLRNLYERAYHHETPNNKTTHEVFQQYMAELHRHKADLPASWRLVLNTAPTFQAQAKRLITLK